VNVVPSASHRHNRELTFDSAAVPFPKASSRCPAFHERGEGSPQKTAHVRPVTDTSSLVALESSMRPSKQFFVYIMTNGPKSAVLYISVTGNLRRRVRQHKSKLVPGLPAGTTLPILSTTSVPSIATPLLPAKKKLKAGDAARKLRLSSP
jgi:predicted GIY-YIG superfamily endonuclease